MQSRTRSPASTRHGPDLTAHALSQPASDEKTDARALGQALGQGGAVVDLEQPADFLRVDARATVEYSNGGVVDAMLDFNVYPGLAITVFDGVREQVAQ